MTTRPELRPDRCRRMRAGAAGTVLDPVLDPDNVHTPGP